MRTSHAAFALLILSGAQDAAAQETSVATARQLAISGIDAVESDNCDKGAPLLERAEQLHHASVHLQYIARCRAAAGRLVAATEMWRRIIRDGAPEGSSPAVATAVAEAQTELAKALPRLASTTIRAAREYPSLSLTLDSTALPSDMVGTRQVLDPGEHELVVVASGFERWSRRFKLAEGGTEEIDVELTPLSEGAGAAASEGEAAPERQQSSSVLRPAGWVIASVGTASLIAGVVTLLARNNRRSDLASQCGPEQICLATQGFTERKIDDDKGAINDLTLASNVLLWGGAALLAGGTAMIVIAGQAPSKKEPRTALLVGAPRAVAGLTVQVRW